MLLYHYVPKGADLSKGIYSISKLPQALLKYAKRAGSDNTDEIIAWLEKTFLGRSKAISVLTEPIKVERNDPMLKKWVDTRILVAIEYEKLLADGLIQALYCKKGSDKSGFNEKIDKISFDKIDFSPLSWHLCSEKQGLFFGAVRHYFLVMKDGIIPSKYVKITGIKN